MEQAVRLKLYQVDAFAEAVFGGNPAAVCPLDEWLPDPTLQAIAAENNLAETAFFVPGSFTEGGFRSGGEGYALRWFTPAVEVDLCGHATLASGFVVMRLLQPALRCVAFSTRVSGTLTVARSADDDDMLVMDLPRWGAEPAPPSGELDRALGRAPAHLFTGTDWMAVYEDEAAVCALRPDMTALARLPCRGVVATAPGSGGIDFVSRFFAPGAGIPEDPVTGSAHCLLAPFWAERLGKTRLAARQVSPRGGSLICTVLKNRVELAGTCALYLEGMIHV